MTISELIFKTGIRFRNPLIPGCLDFLMKSQHWEIERLRNHQFRKLKELIKGAYQYSPYYREKFDASGVDVDNFNSLDQLREIPLLSKEEILKNAGQIQIRDYPEKLFYSETSGSSGKPLVFYRNQEWDAWHRASIYRGYSWYGVNPWERNGYFWGYNKALKRRMKTRFLDLLQNRFRLFSYDEKEIDSFIRKLQSASYLSGYSSMIYEVAKSIDRRGISGDLFHLKMIKGTSEKIYDRYQETVKRVFGKKIISEYGAAEAGIIAFECTRGRMHLNMETVIVEAIEGEIVVTNLASKSFPIIRYKLGDYIELEPGGDCACGMKHDTVKNILGRVGKVVYGFKGEYPSLTLYYVFKNLAMEQELVLNYQAIQREKGHLVVNLESRLDQKKRSLLEKEFVKYFEDDLKVVIMENVDMRSMSMKKSDFVSEL
jgi:phenylacetate-CoA ligase